MSYDHHHCDRLLPGECVAKCCQRFTLGTLYVAVYRRYRFVYRLVGRHCRLVYQSGAALLFLSFCVYRRYIVLNIVPASESGRPVRCTRSLHTQRPLASTAAHRGGAAAKTGKEDDEICK